MKLRYFFKLSFSIWFTIINVPSSFGQTIDATHAKFDNYHIQTPTEKAYLHTVKEVYTQGETLWFSAYLVDGSSHIPGGFSTLLYADLINPENEVLTTLSIKIDEGVGVGEFVLDDSLAEGTYKLRAYTNYMRNFSSDYYFSKPIMLLKFNRDTIHENLSKSYSAVDFQLFPEGGQLINGTVNNVAFRITNELGYGMDMVAKIVNEKDEEVGKFTTQHLGMGVFQITPEDGELYFVKYELNGETSTVPFPIAKPQGYQLSVRQHTMKTYVSVKATSGLSFDDCFVFAHIRGKVVAVLEAKPGKDFIYHALENAHLPSGIIHFTVFKSGNPILERLVYIDNLTERPILTTTIKNDKLKRRDRAFFELDIKSVDSIPVSANLSVSVLKAEDEANKIDIENFLLLTSDLSGTIEHPEYYTDRNNPDRMKSLELLMLTHGWRRFDWQDILTDSLPAISYYPEKGFTLEGQVVNYVNRKKGHPARVALSFLKNMDFNQELKTEPDGTFWFDGLQIEDTVTALVRTLEMNEKKLKKKTAGEEVREKGTYITYTEVEAPRIEPKLLSSFREKEGYRKQLNTRLEIEQINMSFDEKIVVLDEVVIKARWEAKYDPYYRRAGIVDKHPPYKRAIVDSVISEIRNYSTIFKLITKLHTPYMVKGSFPNQYISQIGNDGEIPIYLDGMRVYDLNTIQPQLVEAIDYHNTFYGNLDSGFFIYYRTSLTPADPQGLLVKKMIGYHQPTEFYIPKYDIMSNEEKIKPDYRATQYWVSNVKVSDGKASFDYYTSDNRGDFVMYIEGITMYGSIVKDQLKFRVD